MDYLLLSYITASVATGFWAAIYTAGQRDDAIDMILTGICVVLFAFCAPLIWVGIAIGWPVHWIKNNINW